MTNKTANFLIFLFIISVISFPFIFVSLIVWPCEVDMSTVTYIQFISNVFKDCMDGLIYFCSRLI